MSHKKIGSRFMAVVLCIALLMSVTVIAAGEEQSAGVYTPMKVSDELLRVLKQLEGFNPHAYWDYKQYSIGYGSVCPAGYEKYYLSVEDGGQGNTISEAYAEELLRGELNYFEEKLNGFIKHFGLTLTQNQYDALISFSYNVGANWMYNTSTWQYKSTGNLNSAIISGDTGSNMLYGMMLWSMAGQKPSRHILINRRIVELNIYANGVYPADVYADEATPDRYRIVFMDGNGGTVKYEEHGFDAEQPIAIKTEFKTYPTGPDETGGLVTYVLDGWYTERIGGTKVEQLDSSVPTGTVLYAHWKTPGGTPVDIPQQKSDLKIKVTVTGVNVNVRTGPDTYFHSLYKANPGEVMEITEVTTRNGLLWGCSDDKWIALKYTDYNDVLSKYLPMWGRVTSTTLNVRTGPGTDYALVDGVQKVQGDLLLITEWKCDYSTLWRSMMWGKTDEGWVALPYVTFVGVLPPNQAVQSIEIAQNPNKLHYLHKTEDMDVTGGKLLVTYMDGSTTLMDITPEMVSGFDNTTAGENALTITYQEKTTTLAVQITKAKVIFQMEDGTLISEKEYLVGDNVEVPENPSKPGFEFIGWDQEIATVCNGNATYIAVFAIQSVPGDFDGDSQVTQDDAVYLLLHIMFGEAFYPINGADADINGSGTVDQDDAVYLLLHTMFGEAFYPLNTPGVSA